MKLVVLVRSPRTDPGSTQTIPGLSPCDRAALTTALSLAKEDDEVVAFTAGPPEDDQALSAALRGGAHRAMRITDPVVKDTDHRTLATILAGGLRHVGYDLIFAGQRSTDWATGGTGPGVAHMLRLPHVTSVTGVTPHDDDQLLVTHQRGKVAFELLVSPPALLTILAGSATQPAAVEGDLPAIESVNLAEVTLPFRRPLVAENRKVLPTGGSKPAMLERVDGLVDLIKRWR